MLPTVEEFLTIHPAWRVEHRISQQPLKATWYGMAVTVCTPRRITVGRGNGHLVITVADDSGAAAAWLDFTELVELIDRGEM